MAKKEGKRSSEGWKKKSTRLIRVKRMDTGLMILYNLSFVLWFTYLNFLEFLDKVIDGYLFGFFSLLACLRFGLEFFGSFLWFLSAWSLGFFNLLSWSFFLFFLWSIFWFFNRFWIALFLIFWVEQILTLAFSVLILSFFLLSLFFFSDICKYFL